MGGSFAAALLAAIAIDSDFPGGNVKVEGIDESAGVVRVAPDLRDTKGKWFWFNFRVRGAEGRRLFFRFPQEGGWWEKCYVGPLGPAVSRDGGKTWRFLNESGHEDIGGFEYPFAADDHEVRFAHGIPYVESNWREFVAPFKDDGRVRLESLCKSQCGKRDVELLRIPAAKAMAPKWMFAFTARHHCCEVSASYVMEGVIEGALADDETGRWLRQNAELAFVPFMDKDGVEAGDQGKNRQPHDYNRDYLKGIYSSVRAFKKLMSVVPSDRRIFFMDMHSPSVRGNEHDHFFTIGPIAPKKPELDRRWRLFRSALGETAKGLELQYDPKWDEPGGEGWNILKNRGGDQYSDSTRWCQTLPNIYSSFCFEFGYGRCGGVYSPERARALGRAIIQAAVRSVRAETEAARPAVVPAVRSVRITDAKLPPEGYRIRIDAAGKAKVEFADDAGWFYANKTLDQLPKDAKNLEIEDWPAYRWRGVMLDEGRHFFGKTAVKDILARMSALKMNVFHWHLTEDQGWRLDIPGMPELVKYGAVRPCSWKTHTENEPDGKPYGPFFYTPDDVREIVRYAKGMQIRVIPEIELPGHTRALLAAHPEFSCKGNHPRHPWTATGVADEVLCAGNDEAIAFMERVFDKVVEMFPDEVVHIGGDECPKKYWKTCPKCQARMKKLGLKDENELQAWLTHHFVDYLKAKGKRAIGWDEILEGGLGEGAMVQSWRMAGWQSSSADGKIAKSPVVRAAEEGHDVVTSSLPYTYFSLPSSTNETIVYRRPAAKYGPTELLPVEKAYAFDPAEGVPSALKGRIIGSESCNWTEGTRDYENLKAKMWPRTAALAEVLWTGADRPGVEDFLHRMTGAEVVVSDTEEGPVKPMHAVNNGPKKKGKDQIRGNFDSYKAARIPFARTHDANFAAAYGGPHTVDITAIFPDFDADENDPASYDFACTDDYLATMRAAGTEPFYRLGQSIEHTVKKYGSKPPRDFAKWARICEHVIAHYTEGWAKGHTWDIRYWEIWNEPDNQNPADVSRSSCWGGTAEQFHEFFKTAATHLKRRFPNLKIGGPAVCWNREWATKFLDYMKKENVPLDFFSWHIYTTDVDRVADRCRFYRRLLDERGYTKTESICNEWNYVRDFRANWVYSLRVESGDLNHKGAAYIAAVLCAAQQAPVDMMMYYDARIGTQMNGMFDFVTLRPLRGYYPFYAWSKLAELGRAVRVSVKDASDVRAAAAVRGAHGAVLVARYTDDNNVVTPRRVRVRLPEGTPAKVRCHVTDDCRVFTEQPLEDARDGVVTLELEPAAFALVEW